MKLKSFLMSCVAACAFAAPAMAEGGMFEGALPENMKADVVAAVKYNYYNFSNWQQDGTSNYTWLVTFDADLQNQWKVANWRNLIDFDLGQTWTKGLGKRKSSDRIFWESMLDFNMTEVLKPYVGNRFETQMIAGYKYSEDEDGNEVKTAISSFMDPAYETQVAGLAYIPNDMFSQRIGFANRMTISDGYGYADDHGAEKIARGDRKHLKTVKDEPGLESVTEFKYAFSDIVSFKSRLWAFVNFEGVEEIDGRWENLLTVSIAPLVELQVGYDMAYDLDQDTDTQYKTMVLFGLTWKMF
ncbi:DUF3078 domain-containing protein [Fibrobacter sp. UWEL]|uniref:DUF3078 domain-containing protein n=1 Tax=Fibrobacter sp. UWEL TaxID=1896209 RepID=UPI00091F47CD|nr:DUF3078 domain-containing protein [Fibrobacter sp. UWEL]SHK54815.1 Protein of unknown function, DUF481 [Fibrobacter sp. UWEL]